MSETDTKENPLVAKPVEAKGLSAATTGSGIFSDVASTINDASDPGWGLALDVGTDALDLLGAAMDPLGTLAGAGVGWLIEHISFLKEGLDKLAGNPDEVTAKSVTWNNISKDLTACADTYEKSAATLAQTHKGDASNAYQATAKSYADTLRAASGHAGEASTALTVGAALVGTERGLIRDLISSFVGDLIIKAVAALATSWCSFGASVAAFIADTVLEGAALAEKIGTKIAKVVEKLETLAQGAGKSKTAIEAAANGLKKAGKSVDSIADKGLNAAAKIDSKANELTDAAAAAKKVPLVERASTKAEEWKDATKTNFVDKPLDKIDDATEAAKAKLGLKDEDSWTKATTDRLTGKDSPGEKYSDGGRQALSGEKWVGAIKDRIGGQEFHAPAWSKADTVGAATEASRQEHENINRQKETQGISNEKREAAEKKSDSPAATE
ncbi:MAG: hypothetical protein JWQ81_6660 [Amycolatopsis sp.]|jgi:biotin operon repressor|uniref:hypothetical protein n=1 Tax=Amycolatopsis sp. TaxID=37632 RepID=UPI00261E64BD|nr:hypothetical protein [Amycolatopsis sp.]MCU1685921.1 hypothetical protein [Amycolatopsis sp.]